MGAEQYPHVTGDVNAIIYDRDILINREIKNLRGEDIVYCMEATSHRRFLLDGNRDGCHLNFTRRVSSSQISGVRDDFDSIVSDATFIKSDSDLPAIGTPVFFESSNYEYVWSPFEFLQHLNMIEDVQTTTQAGISVGDKLKADLLEHIQRSYSKMRRVFIGNTYAHTGVTIKLAAGGDWSMSPGFYGIEMRERNGVTKTTVGSVPLFLSSKGLYYSTGGTVSENRTVIPNEFYSFNDGLKANQLWITGFRNSNSPAYYVYFSFHLYYYRTHRKKGDAYLDISVHKKFAVLYGMQVRTGGVYQLTLSTMTSIAQQIVSASGLDMSLPPFTDDSESSSVSCTIYVNKASGLNIADPTVDV